MGFNSGFKGLKFRNFQFNGYQRPNLRYSFTTNILWIQSTSVVIGNSATLLLESSLLNIVISLTTRLYFTSIYSEPAVTTHNQLINQEAVCTSTCAAVEFSFNF